MSLLFIIVRMDFIRFYKFLNVSRWKLRVNESLIFVAIALSHLQKRDR